MCVRVHALTCMFMRVRVQNAASSQEHKTKVKIPKVFLSAITCKRRQELMCICIKEIDAHNTAENIHSV